MISAASVLASLVAGTLASAQEAAPVQAEQPASLETIIVTARKRAENIETVPLSIQAFTAEAMERSSIRELQDVSLFTPGFSFDNYNGGLAAPVMRGATQQSINALEQNVSIFLDGLYLPRTYLTDLTVMDMERIEVVKGPQSARYGRNAFMGVINYVPKKPGTELEATARLTAGNHDRLDYGAAISVPIGDILGVRGSYFRAKTDGTIKNLSRYANADIDGPSTKGNLGGYDREQFTLVATARPIDRLTIEGAYYRFEYDDEAAGTDFFANNGGVGSNDNNNCGAADGTPASPGPGRSRLFCGVLKPVKAVDVDPRAYGRQMTADLIRGGLNFEIIPSLTLAYTFGKITADTAQVAYTDTNSTTCPFFGANCVFQNVPIGSLDYQSHEGRLSWRSAGFDLTGGIYYNDGDDRSISSFGIIAPITSSANIQPLRYNSPGMTVNQDLTTKTKDLSFFGEVIVRLFDGRLRLGAEGRYQSEDKTQVNNLNKFALSGKFNAFMPRFTLDFDARQGLLVYASGAKGVRSGGFNANATLVKNREYGAERNWTYELGMKGQFMDGKAQINASAFYVDATDTQISSPDEGGASLNTNIILNLGDYTSRGGELSIVVRPVPQLTVNAAVAYTDAHYGTAFDNRYRRLCNNVVCPTNGDISGNQLPRYSPWDVTLGARYEMTFSGDYDAYLQTDLAHKSAQYVEQMNLSKVQARTLLNASLGLSKGPLALQLWAKNLLDLSYISQSFFTASGTSGSYAPVIGPRRTVGITGTLRY